ncbi:proline iminopeptidase-family hydrolase [Agromyces archimandritae]|uniref:Proline iminopeptidase n=1 Tax=Agromyces archimandritae TaxID=2781962 RepID=A0A975IPV5_9MICO|nr:proline iminopeptidase-family hydrolase [Agromyces archimandritae]QTX05689.1 proline iminopeptidase-family hydrolase [Agromyces archimandritae]
MRTPEPTDALESEDAFVPTPQGRLWARSLTRRRGPAPGSAPEASRTASRTRPDDGPVPLVILHGGPGFPSDYLHPLAAGLAEDRPVVVYDQIGAGRSDPVGDPAALDVELYVDHLERVRRHFRLDRFHVLGHSWGGFLALAYTESHPERVASLVLASPLVEPDRWDADARALIGELPADHRRSLAAGPLDPGYAAAEAEFYRRHFCRLEPWPAPLQAAADGEDRVSYTALWGPNEFTNTGRLAGDSRAGVIPELTVPSLWITGTDDEARPQTVGEYAAMSDASELAVLPGTHCVHLEAPNAYLAEVRRFLHRSPHDRRTPRAPSPRAIHPRESSPL